MQTETKTKTPPKSWHTQTLEVVLKQLKTDKDQGLAPTEVQNRQTAFGKNVLPQGKKTTALQMFAGQFKSPLVWILLIAAVLTYAIHEYADMTVILIVVIINAIIGFFQEFRANKIFEKLKAIVRVEALVIRSNKLQTVDSEELVNGDIIVLKGGSKVPADARLLTAANLQANEALLTGESKPTSKQPGIAPPNALVGDRTNMVFMGTVLEEGEGTAVIVATGAKTEIGQISLLTQKTEDEDSPLAARMEKLARFLTQLFIVMSLAIFITGIIEGDKWEQMVTTTIAMAVAAIPEGLPAAISIVLAVASKKILGKKGLVMRLIAAETLGSTSVICTDKTGTLTFGQMRVEEILAEDKTETLLAMGLANEAVIEDREGKQIVRGESTDKAKLENFLASGASLEDTQKRFPRQAILSFDPVRKYLASFHKSGKEIKIYVSGAPETVLENSNLPTEKKQEIRKTFENYANRGFRMIALASRNIESTKFPKETKPEHLAKLIEKLDYLGLAAIRDPIRNDVRRTLDVTRKAGIKVIMITGDHLLTAKAIGLELGFKINGDSVVSGEDLDKLSDSDLKKQIGSLEIVSRAAPIHKMRIIDAWQSLGAVVAMTGDGVNDAPALKSADIGVAIGSGTDVSKEASDLILLDDSFSTITAAVEEGRTAFANIRKATVAVMSNAFTEIVLIGSTLIFSIPFPVTAIQILWVNIVEDGLPVLAMAFEPSESEIMKTKPTSPEEPILDREAKTLIFVASLFTDFILVGIFMWMLKNSGWSLLKIQTFIFIMTATPTLINVFSFKSLRTPITRIKLFNNAFLIWAVVIGYALMLIAVYMPFFNRFLKTVPLGIWPALFSLLLFPLFKLALMELTKWWYRNHRETAS